MDQLKRQALDIGKRLVDAAQDALDQVGEALEDKLPPRRPAVGTAAMIIRDGKLLLGLRQGSHAAGVWALPGGHLEWGEQFDECLRREVTEETGLVATTIDQLHFTNNVLPGDDRHYVTLYFRVEVEPGEVQLMEPDKCERWDWFALDDLPSSVWPGLDKTLHLLRDKL